MPTQPCVAPELAIEIGVSIRQHPTVLPARSGGSGYVRERGFNQAREEACEAVLDAVAEVRDLIWLRLVRQEVTIAEVAATEQVDRSTIIRIRTVAKDGALAALAASKPGVGARQRDYELEQAQAEVARLWEAGKELAVRLTLVEGKGGWG